ncbi:hypothetical protein Tsubulata_006869 [Turnera subulata]|uniref:F-box domain-containing protein n=1 Tax=Turnera subulata TaxID=218843 RepID=A0A9Q0GD43_9ROSI|nr:hypothetical protein Tsubulata_006869 [Turnera subulata]
MGAANLRLLPEIVEEILALLPQQSIHRFRSVSKSWSYLLVSEGFHKLRSRSSPPEINVQKLLHHYDYKYNPDRSYFYGNESLDFRKGQSKNDEAWLPTVRKFARFVGSCNGLVCVTHFAGHSRSIRDIAVWNPFTGVYRKLPQPEYTSGPDYYGPFVALAYGFGHDSVGDDYKVFLAAHHAYAPALEDRLPIVQIFSLKTGSWKKVENLSRYLHLLHDGGEGLYLNGALHWESRTGKRIIAFDLVEEKFSEVRAPVVERSYEHVSMGIVGEYLCMCWHPMGNNREMVVWVMKEHGNWVPFIQYNGPSEEVYRLIESSHSQSVLVVYECNFIPPAVKDRGYMMLYFRSKGETEILQWNDNHGEADAVKGSRKQYKFYRKHSSIPYTEALTSPYPAASEAEMEATIRLAAWDTVSVEFHKLRSRSPPPEINVQKLLHHYLKTYPDSANTTVPRAGLESLDFPMRELPQPEYTSGPDHYGLAPLAYGFGHDSAGDDYKVFLAAYHPYAPIPEDEVQVFSLKTGSWKKVEIRSRYLHLFQEGLRQIQGRRFHLIRAADRGLYLNGALHWESLTREKIIAFDLVEEKFSDGRAPVLGYSCEHVSMRIVGEYLCMCWRSLRIYGKKVVWVMMEHGDWVPFIQYNESGLVAYECNFIAPDVKDRGYMMLYFHFPGQTERLHWNNNHGEAADAVEGGRIHYKFLQNKFIHSLYRGTHFSLSSCYEEFQKLRFNSATPELNVQKLLRLRRSPPGRKGNYIISLESWHYRGGEETFTKIIFPEKRKFLNLIGSCNGLFCLARESLVNDYEVMFVWNPFTGVYRKLPDPEGVPGSCRVCRAYGFGYDSAANDYKVFLASARRWDPIPKHRMPVVQIFSLKTGDILGCPSPSAAKKLGTQGHRNGGRISECSVVWVMKEYLNEKSRVPFIEYCTSLRDECTVCYHCNFTVDSVQDKEDGGYLMFYLHDVPTEILKWDKNLGKI